MAIAWPAAAVRTRVFLTKAGFSPQCLHMQRSPRNQSSLARPNAFGSPLPGILESHGWEGAWSKGVTPWDTGAPSPIITYVVQQALVPLGGPVLVPGCGSGHDALAWSAQGGGEGQETVGLDISSTALRAARCNRDKQDPKGKLPVSFVDHDFFTYTHKPCFRLGWDYTFGSALPPALLPQWAASWRRLLAKDGMLALLMFPVGKFEGGPPYAMDPPAMCSLLEGAGFITRHLHPIPADVSIPARAGREVLGLFTLDAARYPSINSGVHRYRGKDKPRAAD